MFSFSKREGAQPVSPAGTLPRDPLAWAFAALLLLLSYDVFARTDAPVLWASGAFLAVVAYRRDWRLLPPALVVFFMFPVARLYPAWVWRVPTAPFLVPFLLCALVCAPFAALRKKFRWLRKGKLDQVAWLLVALTSLVSALALILWALWTDYLGVATHMIAPLKTVPRWISLLVFVPGFALANAAAEEAVYRGVLQEALEESWASRPWAVIALQATAFAAAHFRAGFPNGKLGYVMVFVYALMLGGLRRRTGGVLAPYVAHVCADAVIGATLVLLVS